jgi:hypothetical protein
VGQKTLGGGWKHVEKMKVGWGVKSWPIIGINRVGKGKCPIYAWLKGFGKM